MSRIRKAIFAGARGRGALRRMVRSAVDAQERTGVEHGFHAGKAGVDTKLERGGPRGIRWSARASVGQMVSGGALHHTHPKGHGQLSPQDLRSVVTSPNPKGGRNTLWAHSKDGHEAAKLTRRAAEKPPSFRAKAFMRAYRSTKGQGLNALRQRLKRYGLIHSASTVRVKKALDLIEKARRRGTRGYNGPPHTVIRGGRAMTMKPRQPYRTSLRGGSDDLMEAARGKTGGVSPRYRGKRDGDLNNDGKPDRLGAKKKPADDAQQHYDIAASRGTPAWYSMSSRASKERTIKDAAAGEPKAIASRLKSLPREIKFQRAMVERAKDQPYVGAKERARLATLEGELASLGRDKPNATKPAAAKPKRDTSIRAKLMRRVERAPKDVPRNQIPEGVVVSAARPAGADGVRAKAQLASRDEEITTSWGAKLKARKGKDMILTNAADPKDRWVVRGDIFDATYKDNGDGTASKDPKQIAGYWVAPKAMTIETLEGPVGAAAGDHVMIGAVGEMWPVKPEKFKQRYKPVRLRKSALSAYELETAIAKARGMISRGSSRLADMARARADHWTNRFVRQRGKEMWRSKSGAIVDGVNSNLLRRALKYETIADKLALRIKGGYRMKPAGAGRVTWLRRSNRQGAYR